MLAHPCNNNTNKKFIFINRVYHYNLIKLIFVSIFLFQVSVTASNQEKTSRSTASPVSVKRRKRSVVIGEYLTITRHHCRHYKFIFNTFFILIKIASLFNIELVAVAT